ncbi:MAG: hypothetical protein E7524_00475 [Ruminococcaceae bacterium]|nr:hypothetical protein [Oscillospiraceae bacterium]
MVYSGKKLKEISFPLGGIGTGSIGLAGNGCLLNWEIFNRPSKGSYNDYCHFAVKAEYPDGRVNTRVLMGDTTYNLTGNFENGWYVGFGHGPERKTLCGMPHFKNVKFDGKFPITTLTFEDENFPAKVIMKAFNPFIPLDADNSSIPAAFFDITFKSREVGIKYTVVFTVCNRFDKGINKKIESDKFTAITMKSAEIPEDSIHYRDMTIAVAEKDGLYQEYWYRGGWEDCLNSFWYELNNGDLENRHYENAGYRDKCSVGAKKDLDGKNNCNFRFIISWNMPNNYNYWEPYKDESGKDISWKNYYATLFKDSVDSCSYSLNNWDMLYKRTNKFCKSLHSSTVDKAIIDAVSSTMSVLKSPTVLRLEDGTFYGFEGTHQTAGSCEGTCTHVWSYAYALCFLFPELERSIRDTELKYNMDENGKMQFRSKLPLERGRGSFHPCVDGQMANLVKIHRDWKISGNTEWLKENWEDIKKLLEFAWSDKNGYEWDKDRDGVLEGRQHHTLDMELFGPSSWLEGMYLAALKATAEMAKFLGDTKKAEEYTALFESGYKWTKENLFNGEYFFHKINLKQKEYSEHFSCRDYWNTEKEELKYQIGEGCAIDQMLGQWHASISSLGDIFDKEQRKTALKNLFKYNFRENLREHTNPWRSYALNDEGGTLMCSYPEGTKKPVIPMVYCEECWTGCEYAFAGLLMSEGLIDEGIKVVRTARARFTGENRNPWNEFECGSNYARPMSSFAMLPILSGYEFDMPNKHIGFIPKLKGDFKCFFSIGSGWGSFIKTERSQKIVLNYGELELRSVSLENTSQIKNIYADGKPVHFHLQDKKIVFNDILVKKELQFEY